MIHQPCARLLPHHPHTWQKGAEDRVDRKCPGLPGSTNSLQFTLGEDARAGDSLAVDPHSGLLFRTRL